MPPHVITRSGGATGHIITRSGSGGGGGGFWHGLGGEIGGIVHGIIPGAVSTFGAFGSDLIHHSIPSSIYDVFTGNIPEAFSDLNPLTGEIGKKLIIPAVKSETGPDAFVRHPIRNIEQGRILQPIIDALTIASLGGGRILAMGLTPAEAGRAAKFSALVSGKYGGPERELTARISDPAALGLEGEAPTQVTRELPRSGYRAGKAIGLDWVGRKTFGTSGLKIGSATIGQSRGEFARAAKAAKRGLPRTEYLAAISDPRVQEFQHAYRPLSIPERIAFNVIGRVPLGKDLQTWRTILKSSDQPAARQTLAMIDDPKVMKEFAKPGERLQRALDAWQGITNARQEILLRHGALDPLDIEEGIFRHTRILRGAQILTKDKAYKRTRKLDAEISKTIGKQDRLMKLARKIGMRDITTQIREGRRATLQGTRSASKAAKYESLAATTDAKLATARALRDSWRRVASGEMSIHDVPGLDIPSPSSFHGLAGSFIEAEIQAKIDRLQGFKRKLGKGNLDPAQHDEKIAALEKRYESLNPKTQGPWRMRVHTQLQELKAARNKLRQQARFREGWDAQIAKHKQDIADLRSGKLVEQPIEDIRMQQLGALNDQLGKAYDDYERALTAEHAYQKAIERGHEATARTTASTKALGLARERRIQGLQGLRAQYHELIDARHELLVQKDQLDAMRGRLVGGGTADELAAEMAAAGRPAPGYLHDQPATTKKEYIATSEGSIGPPRPQADVYPTSGVLFRHGIIDLTGDNITAGFFRAAKHQLHLRLHNWAMENGLRVPRNRALPEGYEWVRKYRGQRIPEELTAHAEHVRAQNPFDGLQPDEYDEITGKSLTDEEIASVENGQYRIAVPKQVADQFRAEFDSGKTLGRTMLRRATNVWRALLLRTRINWLENNIIGNTILASIRFAGVNGLKAFVSMVGSMAGPRKALQLLNMDVTRQTLTHEQLAKVFPQAIRGTHVETNIPTFAGKAFGSEPGFRATSARGTARAAYRAKRIGAGAFNLLPRADRWTEQFLRKAAVETTLRSQPEVRAIYKAQAKGSKSWQDAMVQGVEKHPHLQPLAVREMNDALGDFLSLSKFEREQIRQLIPFYAWLREITRISGKIVFDTPGRAKLLTLLGQVGAETSPSDVPSYLRGGIKVSGLPGWLGGTSAPGQQEIVATRAMNPFTSAYDVGAGLATLLHPPNQMSTRTVASQLSPFFASLLSLDRDQPIAGVHAPLILQPLVQTIQNLPQYRMAFGAPSQLYPTRGSLDKILQGMGGSPFRTYDIAQAQARVGQ